MYQTYDNWHIHARDAFEKELLKSEEKVEELSESIDKMTILEDLYRQSNSD